MTNIDAVLQLDDLQYAKYIAAFVDEMDPATRAHLAVAYQNLIPALSALRRVSEERGQTFTVEDLISQFAEEPDDERDEIGVRRRFWFLFAALLARLEKLARRTEAVAPIAASTWALIITEYPRLKALLPHNVVWKESEKEWFELDEPDEKLMEIGINYHIPPRFARDPVVERFATDLGVFYWPQKNRIGFVP